MPRIVFLDTSTLGSASIDPLRSFGELITYPVTRPEQVIERIREADIVISNKVVIDRNAIQAAPNLRLICVAATGTNNIDLEAAKEKGIPVKNAVGYSTQSVAQHTFAMLLYLLEQLNYFDRYVKSGGYTRSEIFTHFGHEYWQLAGKQMGIIGLGAIGREVAKIATAFGSEVVYYSASGKAYPSEYKRVDLEELLQTSDVVSIHAPLNEHTRELIGYEQLRQMKQTGILINVGRGGIVKEEDLKRALDEEKLFAAGLDVLQTEPMQPGHPLLSVKHPDRLLITPHIAWASQEARNTLLEQVGNHIKAFLGQ